MLHTQPASAAPPTTAACSLERVVEALSRPSTYNYPGTAVEVRETHISVVFLVGAYAYKIKKPVNLGFLDFTTLERRREACTREVMLNRRLAPDVYLGVLPITMSGHTIGLGGYGKVVEYAVCMRRLPDTEALAWRVEHGEVEAAHLDLIARRIAHFHDLAQGGPEIARLANFEHIRYNALENFEQTADHVGLTVDEAVYERVRSRTAALLETFRPLFEARAPAARDTHGDIRLDHIYFGDDARDPQDVRIIDCIEFNDRFRYADPISDIAFPVMELQRRGRDELARRLTHTYFRYRSDDAGRQLLAFYVAYRAVVRAKVEGIRATQASPRSLDRQHALEEARAHWLVALSALVAPAERPAVVLTFGLPGTGKSTLARALAERTGAEHIATDVVRKELAAQGGQPGGIYTEAWNQRTYQTCLSRAEAALARGQRVVLDGTFRRTDDRAEVTQLARRRGVPLVMLQCQATDEELRQRLAQRKGDASDADYAVYVALKGIWQPLSARERQRVKLLPPRDADTVLNEALDSLRRRDLL